MENNTTANNISADHANDSINIKELMIGANIYNMFVKSGLTDKPDVEKWKQFEKDIVKYFYMNLGMENAPDEICNFSSLFSAFSQALTGIAVMEAKLKEFGITFDDPNA